jgi:sec-independent protein translocase protein TatA
MFGLQPLHIVLIVIIALLVFGPSRFTSLGRAFGKMISEFRSASKEAPDASKSSPSKATHSQDSAKKE